mgnify:CR=1 FL=1|tara:strand:- start:265 stop:462 length:198 start_codon:yes stop_codon:yes gene_type:complete
MTRKHFIKLAKLVKDNTTLANQRSGIKFVINRGEFMNGLCNLLKSENPNFDEKKFREATGEILGE